jgi:hypothetical protein
MAVALEQAAPQEALDPLAVRSHRPGRDTALDVLDPRG